MKTKKLKKLVKRIARKEYPHGRITLAELRERGVDIDRIGEGDAIIVMTTTASSGTVSCCMRGRGNDLIYMLTACTREDDNLRQVVDTAIAVNSVIDLRDVDGDE